MTSIAILAYISLLSVIHFVADFVLQSNWMAVNKSKSFAALGSHVGVYTLVLLIAGMMMFNHTVYLYSFVLINGLLHFLTDFVTSRINAELYKNEDKHNFFVMVGADQLIHALCLVWTFWYFLI